MTWQPTLAYRPRHAEVCGVTPDFAGQPVGRAGVRGCRARLGEPSSGTRAREPAGVPAPGRRGHYRMQRLLGHLVSKLEVSENPHCSRILTVSGYRARRTAGRIRAYGPRECGRPARACVDENDCRAAGSLWCDPGPGADRIAPRRREQGRHVLLCGNRVCGEPSANLLGSQIAHTAREGSARTEGIGITDCSGSCSLPVIVC